MRLRRNPCFLYLASLPVIFLAYGRGTNAYQWALYQGTAYVVIPLVISLLLGFRPSEVGFRIGRKGGYRWAAILLAVSVPVSLYGLTVPSMREYYPIFHYSGWPDFAFKELLMGVVMFSNEAFFRGFLLMPLSKGRREIIAILAQNVPYTLVHMGKPGIEVPYAFFAGLIFAKMDLNSRSFLPSFLVHWIGSAFFDVLCVLY